MPDPSIEQQLREMNAALIVSSIHQHELTEAAQKAEKTIRERDERLSEEAHSLSLLNEASSRLWRAKTMQEGLDEILNSVIVLLGADMGSIKILDTSGRTPAALVHKGFLADSIGISADFATQTSGRVVIEDVDAPGVVESIRLHAHQAGYRALQSTPLVAHDGTFLGLLSTFFRATHRPTEQDFRRLDLYVRQAAACLVRHQTEEALERELEATRQLQKLGTLIVGEENLTVLYNQIIQTASTLLDSNFASMQLWDEERGSLEMIASFGFNAEFEQLFKWVTPESNTTCAMALREGRRIFAPDYATFQGIAGTPECDALLSMGVRASQSSPLRSRSDRLLGMISTHWSEPHTPTEQDFLLMDLLARQAADLIDRKQFDDALVASERWRRQALDAANLGTWNLDPATSLFTSDARFKAIFGSTVEGRTKDQAIATMHPGDQERVNRAVLAAMSPEERAPYDIEYRVVHADGSTKWVLAKGGAGFVDTSDGARLESFAGTIEDITYRKGVEEALKESEDRFRFMAESMPQKIFTANVDGEFTYLNPQWSEFTGLSNDAIHASGWQLFIHPAELVENLEVWQDSIQTGKSFQLEHRFRRADGKFRWHISRAEPMRNEEGNIVMWVGSNTDVDDVKRADEAMRERLELEVQQRTAELLETNEQLQGFTYSVAHDLRQQIRGISSNASILLIDSRDALDTESCGTLNRLVDSSIRLAKLVDDLLIYARLGRQEPSRVELDMTAMVNEVAAFLVERGACGSTAQFRIAKDMSAQGDPQLIRVVVENLLDNACKYSSENENSVIEFDRSGDAFFVRDNGIGFDMQYGEELFQPFERLHPESAYAGTGIGLANVKRIIEKHGGKVWAEGKPGKGATFHFNLP